MSETTFKPVTQENWADLERLFEARGGPSYCWCMAWREMANRTGASKAERKAVLRNHVDQGVPIGLLAYLDGEPAGWCSVGPKSTFRDLTPKHDRGTSPVLAGITGTPPRGAEQAPSLAENVWSITCFFVPRRQRGTGLAGRLLDAAVEHAFRNGAETVEAYPVDPDSPSYRFMGFVDTFRRRGFAEIGMAGSRRHVMRLSHG